MEKVRYDVEGAPINGTPIAVRADVFNHTAHLHLTEGEFVLGMLTVTWTDQPGSLEKMLVSLDRFVAQLRLSERQAANG